MPLKDTDSDLIDKFLFGQLNPTENQSFAQRQSDTAFQEELAWRKKSLAVFKKSGRSNLKNRLQNLEQNLTEKERNEKQTKGGGLRVSSKQWLSIAAGISLILMALWWMVQTPSSNDLFAQYYQPYPNVVAPIVKSEEVISTYQQGFQSYEQGDYREAEEQLKIFSDKEESQFYLALTYLAQDKSAQAIPLFQSIAEQPTARFYEAAQWYLAMAYINESQIENARSILETIGQNKQHPFYTKSLNISKEL